MTNGLPPTLSYLNNPRRKTQSETRAKAGGNLMKRITAAPHSWGRLPAGQSSPAPDTPKSSRFHPG